VDSLIAKLLVGTKR